MHCGFSRVLTMQKDFVDLFYLMTAESMSGFGLWGREAYPERPGVPECAYYMRTGFCGYGPKCRYSHPRDRASVSQP